MPDSTNSTLKRNLFFKSYEIEALTQEFQKIMLLPKKSQVKWVRENQFFLNSMMDSFLQDSYLALEPLDFDQESIKLSSEYVGRLREVVIMIRSIVDNDHRLES